ncbi:uncharacterized protein AMSG_10513 [Thecamonas trahens ATCC 50062]|uniref:Uncharacterized protein n=1 Tax=Thecamonas trahens ATCC 50062 TaxID=461836 RepID=A0A0L0DTQ7_THETB|nr:hypothetical protein AMSG_10513 [Thecamonas trahens ATCC 50062]KNC54863.1 hypothetical protein AMSG_10513 [Thecamonas trahens ATCC 50062]|eukprot:XP_013753461.1 hypothetical protein AMSG_10513 [Thecamonas trahens ATCC 50062]
MEMSRIQQQAANELDTILNWVKDDSIDGVTRQKRVVVFASWIDELDARARSGTTHCAKNVKDSLREVRNNISHMNDNGEGGFSSDIPMPLQASVKLYVSKLRGLPLDQMIAGDAERLAAIAADDENAAALGMFLGLKKANESMHRTFNPGYFTPLPELQFSNGHQPKIMSCDATRLTQALRDAGFGLVSPLAYAFGNLDRERRILLKEVNEQISGFEVLDMVDVVGELLGEDILDKRHDRRVYAMMKAAYKAKEVNAKEWTTNNGLLRAFEQQKSWGKLLYNLCQGSETELFLMLNTRAACEKKAAADYTAFCNTGQLLKQITEFLKIKLNTAVTSLEDQIERRCASTQPLLAVVASGGLCRPSPRLPLPRVRSSTSRAIGSMQTSDFSLMTLSPGPRTVRSVLRRLPAAVMRTCVGMGSRPIGPAGTQSSTSGHTARTWSDARSRMISRLPRLFWTIWPSMASTPISTSAWS